MFPQSVQQHIISNMRYGGKQFNNGGPLLTEFNEGGSHEENPLGGIPQGIGANGAMNTVEKGEAKYEDYVYSDRIKLDEQTAEEFNLDKKYIGKSFADIAKKINNPGSKREYDPIEEDYKRGALDSLTAAQEAQKEREAQNLMAEAYELDPNTVNNFAQQSMSQQGGPQGLEGEMMQQQLSPEEQQMLEQQAMMEQEQMMAAQQGMDPGMDPAMQGQPMMAYGGPLSKYAFGGYTNSFNMGGQMSGGCPPHHHKDNLGICVPNWYVGMLPEFIGMGASAIGGGMYGAKTAKAQKEKDAAVKQMMRTSMDPAMQTTPTINIDQFQSENMDNSYAMGGMMPIQSYRAGGNCYKCGGKMYGLGGNLAAGISGVTSSLLGNNAGMQLHNFLDKDITEEEANIYNKADAVGGLGKAVGKTAAAALTGNIPGALKMATSSIPGAVQDIATLTGDRKIQGASDALDMYGNLKSFGNTAQNLKNAKTAKDYFGVASNLFNTLGQMPFQYGGDLKKRSFNDINYFANGGSLDDEGNRFLVSSKPNVNANGIVLGYTDTYRVGNTTYKTNRTNTGSIMSEEELINHLKNVGRIPKDADITALEKQANTQRKKIEEQRILDERQRQSAYEPVNKMLSEDLIGMGDNVAPPVMLDSVDPEMVPLEGLDPNMSSMQSILNPYTDLFPEEVINEIVENEVLQDQMNTDVTEDVEGEVEKKDKTEKEVEKEVEEDEQELVKKELKIRGRSPLSYVAPMRNIYQGLFGKEEDFNIGDFYEEVKDIQPDYTQELRDAKQLANLVMQGQQDPRNKLAAYQKGNNQYRKLVSQLEKLDQERKLKIESLNKKNKIAANKLVKDLELKQDANKEAILGKGFEQLAALDAAKRKDEYDVALANIAGQGLYDVKIEPYLQGLLKNSLNPYAGLFNMFRGGNNNFNI